MEPAKARKPFHRLRQGAQHAKGKAPSSRAGTARQAPASTPPLHRGRSPGQARAQKPADVGLPPRVANRPGSISRLVKREGRFEAAREGRGALGARARRC